ncbi:hypothetical protein BV22DRAFT_1135955 [Leucogyrophana mollusca]|uniref:Uncharacterized protein n=1 Tax=Leucogyrophana mollusca TaxID=85980 RepID=A0ACB8ATH6_9AGAM|nr:hypothetical protein BV22DRAFT_1135955 [Leucogyrophana mollusca]
MEDNAEAAVRPRDLPKTILKRVKEVPARGPDTTETKAKGMPKRDWSKPWSALWMAKRLRDTANALVLLDTWVHGKRSKEVNQQTVDELNALPEEAAAEALRELRLPKQYI